MPPNYRYNDPDSQSQPEVIKIDDLESVENCSGPDRPASPSDSEIVRLNDLDIQEALDED